MSLGVGPACTCIAGQYWSQVLVAGAEWIANNDLTLSLLSSSAWRVGCPNPILKLIKTSIFRNNIGRSLISVLQSPVRESLLLFNTAHIPPSLPRSLARSLPTSLSVSPTSLAFVCLSTHLPSLLCIWLPTGCLPSTAFPNASLCLSVCLSVCLSFSVYVSVYISLLLFLPVYLDSSLSFCLSLYLALSISLSVSLSLCMSPSVSLCLFVSLSSYPSFLRKYSLPIGAMHSARHIAPVFATTNLIYNDSVIEIECC